MSRKSIGDVRPSQLITTFGPGSIVDLQTLSVVVAGIDEWTTDPDDVIHEIRLERALQVKEFYAAPAAEGSFFSRNGTVPAYLFPRYQVCPMCHTLSRFGETPKDVEYDERWKELKCIAPNCPGKGKRQTMPAPFIVACPSGHLDEFPWREFLHGGPTTCTRRMKLFSSARTGTVSDLMIECGCTVIGGDGQQKPRRISVSAAFGANAQAALGRCTRRLPWLGPEYQDARCEHETEVRAMQRGATNAWFPLIKSALKIKEAATPIGIALGKCSTQQIEKVDSLEKLRTLVEMEMFPALQSFVPDDVWTTIRKMRGEIETDEVDLRWPEWEVLRQSGAGDDESELFLEDGEVPDFAVGRVARVVRARKLLEVRALTGFTRIDYASGDADENGMRVRIAPIYRRRPNGQKPDWLPAVEVRGEGIFIELDEEFLCAWESKRAVCDRAKAMAAKYLEWEQERGSVPAPFPGARFVLLHSLAHVLIRQMSLDCGYSASSVRERIYSSTDPQRRMAGILLYTASADSEGSLGGLVDLGDPKRFPDLLKNALLSARQCSSDPLCADHQPDVHATINGAACHACILASETSCECFNRFLDRNMLVPTMMSSDMAFFDIKSL